MVSDYDHMQLKVRYANLRIERDALSTALRTIRHKCITSGLSERQVARMADLSLEELHELIGSYAGHLEEMERNIG
jgi:hypothetical protein